MAIAVLRFLAAAGDGAVGIARIDPQKGGNGKGVLVMLQSGVGRKVLKVLDVGLLEILPGRDFDPVTSLIADSLSSEIDWAWVDPVQL